MSNARTAIILTLLYWSIAVVFALFTPRDGWIDLRWQIAIFFLAIPTTLLLWLFVLATRFFRSPVPRLPFTLIGIALPFAYVAVALGVGHWYQERAQQRLEAQFAAAALETVGDEPLVTERGAIGVRLRYRVTYPKGLDLDESHGAFAQLALGGMPALFFFTSRRTVTPHVSSAFPVGSYEIVEDFLPGFLPPSLLYPKHEPSSHDHCFRWNPALTRNYVLTADAQNLVSVIFISHSPLQKSTGRAYRLADFYATAVKEGGVDCQQNGG